MENDKFEILIGRLDNMESQLSHLTISQSEFQKEQIDTLKRIESILKGLVGVHSIHDNPIGLKQIQESLRTISNNQ
jgi:hypothetical protein